MRGLVLDMDGVMVDSELQWKLHQGPLLRRMAPQWRPEEHDHQIVGLGVVDLYHWMVEKFRITATEREFLVACHELALTVYGRAVTLTPGLVKVLDEAEREGVLLAVASSSPRAWINAVLERFELMRRFVAVCCADDVGPGRTKPEPDIYLGAVQRLGLTPADCVAVEDSRLGVAAAKAAGLYCVALRNGSNEEQDLARADREIRGFTTLAALRR